MVCAELNDSKASVEYVMVSAWSDVKYPDASRRENRIIALVSDRFGGIPSCLEGAGIVRTIKMMLERSFWAKMRTAMMTYLPPIVSRKNSVIVVGPKTFVFVP